MDAVPKVANEGQGDMTNTDIQDGVEDIRGAQSTSKSTPELGQGSAPQDNKILEVSSGKAVDIRYTTEHRDIAQAQRPDPTDEHSYASHQEMLQPSSTTPHEENRRDRVRTQRKADNGEQRLQHHPYPSMNTDINHHQQRTTRKTIVTWYKHRGKQTTVNSDSNITQISSMHTDMNHNGTCPTDH